MSFSDWLISLSITLSRSILAVAKSKISFFLQPSSIALCGCTTAFFPHSSTGGHAGCLPALAVVGNAAHRVYRRVHIFIQISVLGFFRSVPRSGPRHVPASLSHLEQNQRPYQRLAPACRPARFPIIHLATLASAVLPQHRRWVSVSRPLPLLSLWPDAVCPLPFIQMSPERGLP